MPIHPRAPDIVDQEIALRERVRKLEIQHQSKTLFPAYWLPNKREDRNAVMAQHALMMYYGPYVDFIDAPYVPGPSARYCQAQELAHGYTSAAQAHQFYLFRQAIGVYQQDSSEGDYYRTFAGNTRRVPFLDASNGPARVFKFAGPAGDYRWHSGGLRPWWGSDPEPPIPGDGGFVYNQLFSTATGSGLPADDGTAVGTRMTWTGTSGGYPFGEYTSVFLEPGHFYFESPPTMWNGEEVDLYMFPSESPPGVMPTPPFVGGWLFGVWHATLLITGGLSARVATVRATNNYPLVERWYNQHLPIGWPRTSRFWQNLQIPFYYSGSIEMQIAEGLLSMRGSATSVATYPPQSDLPGGSGGIYVNDPIVVLPDYVAPYTTDVRIPVRYHAADLVDRLGTVHVQASGTYGGNVYPVWIQPAGQLYIDMHEQPSAGPYTIYFDGVRFAIRPP
jgi:hypothetical protein